MHEAGIAANIIEIAEDVARGYGSVRGTPPICAIGLRLGAFTGVVRDSLQFAFEALRNGTAASNARLEIREVPLLGACPDCGWSGPPLEAFCLVCPQCRNPLSIVSGREMQVEYVDLNVESSPEGETIDGTSNRGNQNPPQERRVCRSQPAAV